MKNPYEKHLNCEEELIKKLNENPNIWSLTIGKSRRASGYIQLTEDDENPENRMKIRSSGITIESKGIVNALKEAFDSRKATKNGLFSEQDKSVKEKSIEIIERESKTTLKKLNYDIIIPIQKLDESLEEIHKITLKNSEMQKEVCLNLIKKGVEKEFLMENLEKIEELSKISLILNANKSEECTLLSPDQLVEEILSTKGQIKVLKHDEKIGEFIKSLNFTIKQNQENEFDNDKYHS